MVTGALLLILVAAAPQPGFLATDTPVVIRLVARDPPLPSYRGWTIAQLRNEYVRLDELVPGVALPATSLMVGLTGLVVSFIAYASALGNFRGADTAANISFGLGTTVSTGLTAFGIIQLARGASDRRIYLAQMAAVERLADGFERDERLLDIWEQRHGPGALPPPIIGPPPTGPVPPPSAPPIVPGPALFPGRASVAIPLLFARF